MKKETTKPRSVMRKPRRRRSSSPSDPVPSLLPVPPQHVLNLVPHKTARPHQHTALLQLQQLHGNLYTRQLISPQAIQARTPPLHLVQRDTLTMDQVIQQADPDQAQAIERFRQAAGQLDNLPGDVKGYLLADIEREYADGEFETHLRKAMTKTQAYKELVKSQAYKKAGETEKQALEAPLLEQQRQIGITPKKGEKHFESLIPVRAEDQWTQDFGKLATRINFLATFESALGTLDKVFAHFNNIVPTNVPGKPYLHRAAAERLENAAARFKERTGDRASFPSTTVALQIRNRHQHRETNGKLGHPLGIAIDYKAYENPHLHDRRFFIEAVTGQSAAFNLTDEKGAPLGDRQRGFIEQLGEDTNTPDVAPDQRRHAYLLNQVEGAFQSMVDTSKKFQAIIGGEAQKQQLLDALQDYRNNELMPERITALEKKLKKTKGKKAEALQAELDAAKARYEEIKARMPNLPTVLQKLFQPYIDKLNEAIAQRQAIVNESPGPAVLPKPDDRNNASNAIKRVTLGKARSDKDVPKKKAEMQKKLVVIMNQKKYQAMFTGIDPAAFDDPVKLQEALLQRLRSIYYAYEVYRLEGFKKKLQEPDLNFIFGTEFKWDSEGQRHLARTVSEPSMTQLVELGFVRSDELPAEGEPAKGKKPEVQNHIFYEVMLEQGFDPGASWGSMDTMHFDFVKGYRALVGRGSFGPKLGFQPKN